MIPFVGPSYWLNVRKADVQRAVNLCPVANEVSGGKSIAYLESIPGLATFSSVEGVLLQEDGYFILTESGNPILL